MNARNPRGRGKASATLRGAEHPKPERPRPVPRPTGGSEKQWRRLESEEPRRRSLRGFWLRLLATTWSPQTEAGYLSRLLSGLLLALLVLGILSSAEYILRRGDAAGVQPFSLAAVGLLVSAYLLNRAGRFRAALVIALVTLTLAVFAMIRRGAPVTWGDSDAWLYLIVPLLVAEFFLPLPGYMFAAAVILAGLAASAGPRINIDHLVYMLFIASVLGVSSYFKTQVERKRRLAMRESEERGARLIDSARDVIVTTDAEGRITSLSPSFEKFTGWPRARWLGRPYEQLVADEDRANAGAQVARVLRGESMGSLRMRVQQRSGAYMVVEMNVSAWIVDGRPEGLLGIARDMTSEVEAELALRASEARLGALTAATSEAVVFHEGGRILDVNPAAAAMYGYGSAAEIIGRNLMDFVAPESRDLVLQQVRSGSRGAYEAYGLRKDGTTFPVEATGRGVEYGGRAVRVATIRDITERRQAERALREAYAGLAQAYDSTLEGWAKALELRDEETEGHSRRVTELTVRLAGRMGMAEDRLHDVRRGALLHDIGKMGVPDEILRKPGPLDAAEWEEMRKHPQYAREVLSLVEHLRGALEIAYHHHERWDGSGYPGGLIGDEIPLAARVFAVVDVWDALQSGRPYRPAWSADEAEEHLRANAGKLFDPGIVSAFLEMLREPGTAIDMDAPPAPNASD